jgi:hypothetical protein
MDCASDQSHLSSNILNRLSPEMFGQNVTVPLVHEPDAKFVSVCDNYTCEAYNTGLIGQLWHARTCQFHYNGIKSWYMDTIAGALLTVAYHCYFFSNHYHPHHQIFLKSGKLFIRFAGFWVWLQSLDQMISKCWPAIVVLTIAGYYNLPFAYLICPFELQYQKLSQFLCLMPSTSGGSP